jgi:hypothetical protein
VTTKVVKPSILATDSQSITAGIERLRAATRL